MQQTFADIFQFFNTSSFNEWARHNIVWLLALIIILTMGVWYFKPWVVYWLGRIQHKRRVWEYQILVGKKMSKRARDKEFADDLYSWMLDRVNKGKMTHKEKRQRLRILEFAFDLEPGTLRPKPNFQELKRRIKSRLPAELANITEIKPSRRLAAIMNSKG